MSNIYYLTPEENKALALIVQGLSTKRIMAECPMPSSGFHIFSGELKRKTGIMGRIYDEGKQFIERYTAAMSGDLTSIEHTRAMRQYITGMLILPNLRPGELVEILDKACPSAGIFTRDERARKAAVRIYLAIFRSKNGKPLDTLETPILRGLADGMTFEEIAREKVTQPLPYLKIKAKEACIRLGFDSKGRNAQRNLLRAYFAHLDLLKAPDPSASEPAAITMEDPAF